MFSQSVKILWICLGVITPFAVLADQKLSGNVRIVKGEEITIDKAPYVVQIRTRLGQVHQCGGTLVTSQFVVTAAHCFNNRPLENIQVVAGITTLSEEGTRRSIDNLFIHPEYNDDTTNNDIAVLKLNRPLPLGKNIQTVELCDLTLDEKAMLQVYGWGQLNQKDYHFANNLNTVKLDVVPQKECVARHLKVDVKVTNVMVCAWGDGGKDACVGDSGGPGIYGGKLCAVVSWGVGCGRSDYPGVFTRIEKVRDFINEIINREK